MAAAFPSPAVGRRAKEVCIQSFELGQQAFCVRGLVELTIFRKAAATTRIGVGSTEKGYAEEQRIAKNSRRGKALGSLALVDGFGLLSVPHKVQRRSSQSISSKRKCVFQASFQLATRMTFRESR